MTTYTARKQVTGDAIAAEVKDTIQCGVPNSCVDLERIGFSQEFDVTVETPHSLTDEQVAWVDVLVDDYVNAQKGWSN
jgi:hypothetical protein